MDEKTSDGDDFDDLNITPRPQYICLVCLLPCTCWFNLQPSFLLTSQVTFFLTIIIIIIKIMVVIVILVVKIIVHLLIKFIVVVIIALDSYCNGGFFVARIDCHRFLAQCNKRNQSLLPSWYHRQDHHDDHDHYRFWLLMILLIAGKGMVLEILQWRMVSLRIWHSSNLASSH